VNSPADLTAARTGTGIRPSVRPLREGPGKPTASARAEPGSVQAPGFGPDACTDASLLPIADPDRCPVPECTRSRCFGELMCGPHWGQVPKAIQRAVRAAWRDGEGFGTPAHLAACNAAIAAVSRRSGTALARPPRPRVPEPPAETPRQPEPSPVPARAPEPIEPPGTPEPPEPISEAGDRTAAGTPAQSQQPRANAGSFGERLAAAGIGPDDPGLQQWIGWNAVAFARARRKAAQQSAGGTQGRRSGSGPVVSR
jgi:hypothetical protein